MLKPLSDDAQGYGLDLGLSLRPVRTIGQNAWQIRHFRYPPTVFFLLELNLEPQCSPYGTILARFPQKVRRTAAITCEAHIDDAKATWGILNFALRLVHRFVRRRAAFTDHVSRLLHARFGHT